MERKPPAKLRLGDKYSWRGIPILIEVTRILVSMLKPTLMPPIILKMLVRATPIKLLVVPSIHLHSMQDMMRGEEKERER